MNRQAIAFISLFSLILMLSVYYVSMDNEEIAVIQPQDHEVVEAGDDSEALKEKIDEQDQDEIQKQKEILGSGSDSESKNEALGTLAEIETTQKLQDEMTQQLSDAGYKTVVEIDKNVIRVTVYEQGKDQTIAAAIMNLLYEQAGERTIEVSFS